MPEAPKPNSIQLREHDVFLDSDLTLTDLGMSIYFIYHQCAFLQESPPQGLELSPLVGERIRGEIISKFAEVSNLLGIPNDPSLIPELNSQYALLSKKRHEERLKQFRETFLVGMKAITEKMPAETTK